jgi:hypothetical protein
MQTGVVVQRKTIPAWALRLLVGTLLLGPLIAAADGLARVRRRRRSAGRAVAHSALWALSCAAPFFLAAVFARLLGELGIIGAAPRAPVPPSALPFDGAAARAVVAVGLVLVLAWMLWPMLLRRLGSEVRADSQNAGLAVLLVLLGVSFIVWLVNPFTALLLVGALHLWLLLASPETRPRPLASVALVAIAMMPLILLVSFYADELGLGPGELAWTAVLLLAGGHVGIPGALLWSVGFGCTAATVMLALSSGGSAERAGPADQGEITIRGPLSYAGPGSLGGTESALRR